MNQAHGLSGASTRGIRSSLMPAATIAVLMSIGAAACVAGVIYMNTHDVLGYDFGRTPGAYLAYMGMYAGAVCAPLWGVVALITYAVHRRSSPAPVVRSDVLALAALTVLAATVLVVL